jgi:hypothetical protein
LICSEKSEKLTIRVEAVDEKRSEGTKWKKGTGEKEKSKLPVMSVEK